MSEEVSEAGDDQVGVRWWRRRRGQRLSEDRSGGGRSGGTRNEVSVRRRQCLVSEISGDFGGSVWLG